MQRRDAPATDRQFRESKLDMATKILFTAGKGGTGKSTILFNLIDWLREAGIEPYLIDTDDNLTLSRFFPNALKVEVRRSKSLDLIVDTVESGSHPLVIVDHRAGAGYEMVNWYAEVPFEELSEQFGVKFTLIGPVTSSSDSVSSVLHWADERQFRKGCAGRSVALWRGQGNGRSGQNGI